MKINQELLDHHYKVESEIRELIENTQCEKSRKLYSILVERPDTLYQMFGGKRWIGTLDELCGVLCSLNHWIRDDGEYGIVRELDESSSKIFERPIHRYYVTSGWDENIVDVYVEDLLMFLDLTFKAEDYYKEHKDIIENSSFEEQFTQGSIANNQIKMNSAPEGYLENCWKERIYDNS